RRRQASSRLADFAKLNNAARAQDDFSANSGGPKNIMDIQGIKRGRRGDSGAESRGFSRPRPSRIFCTAKARRPGAGKLRQRRPPGAVRRFEGRFSAAPLEGDFVVQFRDRRAALGTAAAARAAAAARGGGVIILRRRLATAAEAAAGALAAAAAVEH